MTTTNDKTLEILFENFLSSDPYGELAEAMHTVSAAIDAQIEAGAVDPDTVADYELAAMKYGFYAGFFAAMNLIVVKTRLARNPEQEREED